MNRISLTDLAKNEPLEPLLEKEVHGEAGANRTSEGDWEIEP
jgi:hypothetical protein